MEKRQEYNTILISGLLIIFPKAEGTHMQNTWNAICDELEHTVFTPCKMMLMVGVMSLIIFSATEKNFVTQPEFHITFKKSGRVDGQMISENMKKKEIEKSLKDIASNFRNCFPKGGEVSISSIGKKIEVVAGGWPKEQQQQVTEFCKIMGCYVTDGKQVFTDPSIACASIDPQEDMHEMIWIGMIE